jgi:hypothetical protein
MSQGDAYFALAAFLAGLAVIVFDTFSERDKG